MEGSRGNLGALLLFRGKAEIEIVKASEVRDRQSIGPGEVTGARTALTRALRLYEDDEDVAHLLTGVETALAHLGLVIDEEGS